MQEDKAEILKDALEGVDGLFVNKDRDNLSTPTFFRVVPQEEGVARQSISLGADNKVRMRHSVFPHINFEFVKTPNGVEPKDPLEALKVTELSSPKYVISEPGVAMSMASEMVQKVTADLSLKANHELRLATQEMGFSKGPSMGG